MESLLITGGSGFLGGNLALMAPNCWKTFISYHLNPISYQKLYTALHLDVTDRDETERIVSEIKPKVIIHTSAVTSFDYSAEHREVAWNINVKGTENVVSASEKVGSRLIYLSTDLVFDGNKSFYSEEETPVPICFYGKTKLEGEKIVSSISSNYCIARTALIFGQSQNSSKCFTETMIDNMDKGKEVRLFVDEYRTPINVENLCDILLEMAERKDLQGLYNICGRERLSRYEFGLKLAGVFGFNRELLIPNSTDNFSFKDKRPKDCSMKNKRAVNALDSSFWSIEEGLVKMYEKGGRKESAMQERRW